MNSIDQLCELVPELIEEVAEDGGELTFSERAKAIVKELADYARQTELYKQNKAKGDEFWSDTGKTAYNVYAFMLDRIVHAPTAFHRDSSIILHIPYLDDIVNGGTEDTNTEEEQNT